jgi:hypothetical protein
MKMIWMSFAPPIEEQIRSTLSDFVPRDWGLLIMVGVLLLITFFVFIWAVFFRKPPRRPHYAFRESSGGRLGRVLESLKQGRLFGHKHRHRRHRDRKRNPTLAEAGGLPPVRSEDQPSTRP